MARKFCNIELVKQISEWSWLNIAVDALSDSLHDYLNCYLKSGLYGVCFFIFIPVDGGSFEVTQTTKQHGWTANESKK